MSKTFKKGLKNNYQAFQKSGTQQKNIFGIIFKTNSGLLYRQNEFSMRGDVSDVVNKNLNHIGT